MSHCQNTQNLETLSLKILGDRGSTDLNTIALSVMYKSIHRRFLSHSVIWWDAMRRWLIILDSLSSLPLIGGKFKVSELIIWAILGKLLAPGGGNGAEAAQAAHTGQGIMTDQAASTGHSRSPDSNNCIVNSWNPSKSHLICGSRMEALCFWQKPSSVSMASGLCRV